MQDVMKELRISVIATLSLAVVLCGIYPLAVFLIARGLFPAQANGSLIVRNGVVVGSSRIAERFTGPGYFHARPSAAGQGYDAVSSGGSNLGPLSRGLVEEVGRRVRDYRAENNLGLDVLVPADAVTASASGLDPHISLRNALLQAPRVAKARGFGEGTVLRAIETCTEGRDLGILGEPRVNVLMLNLALDRLAQ